MTRGRTLPSLNALRAFEAAARLESFTKAAEDLGVTPGAVSRHIRALEESLTVPLFVRENSRVQLTAAGETYRPFVDAAFGQLLDGAKHLNVYERQRSAVIDVMPTFAERWLLPRLPLLAQRYPNVRVRLQTSTEVGAFTEHAQAGIWYGQEGDWPASTKQLLFPEQLIPVASPSLLAGYKPLQSPEHLLALPIIQVASTPDVWPEWLQSVGVQRPLPPAQEVFDTCGLAIQAAVHGLGLMMANRAFIAAELARGELVPAHVSVVTRSQGWYLCQPRQDLETPAVRSFRRWIGTEAEAARTV